MNSSFAFRNKVTVAALILSVVCAVLSFLVLNSMNLNLVGIKLYSYGLTFNAQWANPYGQYVAASFAALMATLFSGILGLGTLAVQAKRGSRTAQKFTAAFSMLTVVGASCSLAFFVSTANLINSTLYNYGLQFNNGWFNTYQLYLAGYTTLQVAIITLSAASFSLVSFSSKQPLKINTHKILYPTLLATGGILIAYSIIYNFTTAFFAGFFLVFWGSIIAFISNEHLIKKDVLDATSLTYLSSLSKTANQASMQKMIYTNPDNIKNAIQNYPMPVQPFPQIQNVELSFGTPEPVNLAPDNELFHLLERKYGKSFAELGFSNLEAVLSKLLVESLELAENVTVQANGDVITVTVKKPFDLEVYLKAQSQNLMIDAAGFPLPGAIAYVLAVSSGQPVVINHYLVNPVEKTVQFEYLLLGQRSVST
jgi:hypothetical protein